MLWHELVGITISCWGNWPQDTVIFRPLPKHTAGLCLCPVPLQFHGHLPQHTAQPKTEVSLFPQCPQTWILNLWFCGLLWFDLRLNAEQFWNQIMSKFDTYVLSFGAKFSIRKKKTVQNHHPPKQKVSSRENKKSNFPFWARRCVLANGHKIVMVLSKETIQQCVSAKAGKYQCVVPIFPFRGMMYEANC